MKKQLLKSALIAVASVGLLAGSAMALDFGSTGTWGFSSAAGTDPNYQELLTFNDGLIYSTGLTLHLNSFSLDESDASSPYNFAPSSYTDGFQIYDGSQLIFEADVKFDQLTTIGATGFINETLKINLSNFDLLTSGYTLTDEMFAAGAGSMVLSFNASKSIDSIIHSSTAYSSGSRTYSASVAAVPEPATMMLFGTGIAGLAGIARRRKNN